MLETLAYGTVRVVLEQISADNYYYQVALQIGFVSGLGAKRHNHTRFLIIHS